MQSWVQQLELGLWGIFECERGEKGMGTCENGVLSPVFALVYRHRVLSGGKSRPYLPTGG